MKIFRLHRDWKKVIEHAWSFRLMCVSCVLSGISVGLSQAQPYLPFNPLWIAAGAGIATALAAFASLIAQEAFDGPTT